MKFYGHTLDELDALRAEFDTLVESCLFRACAKGASGTDHTLTAAAVDVESDVLSAWGSLVDEVMLGHVAATYDGASLSVLMQLADHADLEPGEGLPLVEDTFAQEHLAQARNRLKGIGNDVWQNVRGELLKGQALGESVEELALRVHTAAEVTLPRARVIARTEINAASNAGAYAQVSYLGMTGTQEWLATPDERTRPSHNHADGQMVPLGQTFTVGGYAMKHPGDHNAPASEIVNCRCTVAYDIDPEQPKNVTCAGLAAAAVSTSYCAVPGAGGPPSLVPNAATVDSLTDAQKNTIFNAFQSPKAISPAYGGAKIHKVLDEAVQNLHASGVPEFANLTHADVLAVVDEKYTGGKYTFKEKYEEWLVKKYGSLPSPDPIPAVHVHGVTPAGTHASVPDPAVAPSAPPPTVPHVSSPPPPPKTNKGYTPLSYLSGDVSGVAPDVKAKAYAEFKKNKVTAIWSGNKIYESTQKAQEALHAQGIHLNDHELYKILDEEAAKSGASTGFVDKMLKWEQSGPGKKIIGELPTGVDYAPTHVPAHAAPHVAPPTPPAPPAPPAPPTPPSTATPAGLSIGTYTQAEKYAKKIEANVPFAEATTSNGVKLRLIKTSDDKITYQYFDDEFTGTWKDVSPAFAKTQFKKYEWKTIDVAAPAPSAPTPVPTPTPTPTPPAPTLAVGTKFKTYAEAEKHAKLVEVNKPFAMATGSSGTKYRLVKNVDGDVVMEQYSSIAGKWVTYSTEHTQKFIKNQTWTVIDDMTTIGGPTTTAPSVTVTVTADFKKKLLDQLNSKGPLLGKTGPQVYEKIAEIKVWAKKNGHTLSDLDLLRILDAEKSASLGVDNAFLYEKKITEWLKKPGAVKKAEAILKKVEAGPTVPAYAPTPSTPALGQLNNASELGDISLSNWRAQISTTDTSFPVLDLNQSRALQNEMFTKYGDWTAGEKASLRYYTSNHYAAMNAFLRENKPVTKAVGEHIKKAQQGMRPSTRPLVLHRGTGVKQFGGAQVDKTLVGKTLTDKGFMSTSFGGRSAFGGQVILEIECPTGTPMAFVKPISHYPNENEILLAAGTKYQVVDVIQSGTQKIVKVRVIP